MLKLFSAASISLPFALLLGGCGSGGLDQSERDSRALSTLSAGAPAHGQVVSSGKVVFSGRSSANGTRTRISGVRLPPAPLTSASACHRSASPVTRLASRDHASPWCGMTTTSSVASALSEARSSVRRLVASVLCSAVSWRAVAR